MDSWLGMDFHKLLNVRCDYHRLDTLNGEAIGLGPQVRESISRNQVSDRDVEVYNIVDKGFSGPFSDLAEVREHSRGNLNFDPDRYCQGTLAGFP